MSKENLQNFLKGFSGRFIWVGLGLFVGAFGLGGVIGCTSGSKKAVEEKSISTGPLDVLPPEALHEPPLVKLLWSRQMKGAIGEFSLSGDGKFMEVVTQPDPDIVGSAKKLLLTRLSQSGAVLWQVPLQSAIRDLDLSEDGSLTVTSNYQQEVSGRNEEGTVLWSLQGLCKPRILQPSKQIACFHDDDSEADVAFDLLSADGKKQSSFPITQDLVAFKVSSDQVHLGLGLEQGQALLVSANDGKVIWERKVEGEISDLAVSSQGAQLRVAVLYQGGKKREQKIAIFDRAGNLTSTLSPHPHSLQIEFTPDGQGLFSHGTSTQGESLTFYSGTPFVESWKKQGPLSAAYSSSIVVTSGFVVMGSESSENLSPKIHLRIYDFKGRLRLDLPVLADVPAHLYSFRVLKDTSLISVATDEGRVSLFRLGF